MIFFAGLLASCSSTPVNQQIDNNTFTTPKSLTVVHLPIPEELYVEIQSGSTRYSDVEISLGKQFLTGLVGSALGYWAGWSYAVSGVSGVPGAATAINPWVAAVTVVAIPLATTGIEKLKHNSADKKAKEFRHWITPEIGSLAFRHSLENMLKSETRLNLDRVETVLLDPKEKINANTFLERFDTDLVLVVGNISAFSPHFEVLEQNTVLAMFDTKLPFKEPVFRESLVVQSKLHAGQHLPDTRNEVADSIDRELNEKLELAENQSARSRIYLKDQADRRKKRYQSRYIDWDKHDQDGALWKRDDGKHLLREYRSVRTETVRLTVLSLLGSGHDATTRQAPPGSSIEIERLPTLDTHEREVYRVEEGPMLSLDSHSRLVHLSKE